MVIINLYNIAAHPAPKNGPTQYNQCSVQMLDMTAVPNDLAGFIEAPDTGMPRMDNVICINPIANGAQKVMQVEGDMRMKCAEATSFARQAEEEALVAAAMREGKVLNVTGGNALNGTNSSVV